MALPLPNIKSFLIAKVDKVMMFDDEDFLQYDEIPISLMKADTREPNQVIAMKASEDENYLAIISGKILIMNEQKCNQLFIFKRIDNQRRFELHVRIVLREINEFKGNLCMEYHFMDPPPGKNPNSLLFCKND